MKKVIIFQSKQELSAIENLKEFISFSQKLPCLNAEVEYDSAYWPKVCNFTKLGISSRDRKIENCLDLSIMPFAKAYIAYKQTLQRAKNVNEIKAIRAIEISMLQSNAIVDITQLNGAVFDNAAQILQENYSPGSAYHGGSQLQKLQEFLVEHKLIKTFTWKNPNNRAPDLIEKVGKSAVKVREAKLPDERALLSLAEVFSLGCTELSDKDKFTTSSISILFSAPARGSELFYLKAECIHKDIDSKDKDCTGIKWFSGKGFGYEVEWIPEVMVPVALKAIERLKEITKPSRQWAKQLEELKESYEKGLKTSFPRHSCCPNVADDVKLTNGEAAQALGYSQIEGSFNFISNANGYLKRRGLKTQCFSYCLTDLIPAFLDMLPKSFPYVDYRNGKGVKVKWSEALYCFFKYQLNNQKNTSPVELWMPDINVLNEDLAQTKKKKKLSSEMTNVKSVFQRHDYPDDILLKSHQLRHLLSTIANVNGMSESVLTKWAGRADAKHNRIYNHTPAEKYKTDIALIMNTDSNSQNELVRSYEVIEPESIYEMNTNSRQTFNITKYGVCLQSLALTPCKKTRDCLNCEEQVCFKGDKVKLDNLKDRLALELYAWENMQRVISEGEIVHLEQIEKKKLSIERCKQLISLLQSDKISDGSPIKLTIKSTSRLDNELTKNNRKIIPDVLKMKAKRLVNQKPKGLNQLQSLMNKNFGKEN